MRMLFRYVAPSIAASTNKTPSISMNECLFKLLVNFFCFVLFFTASIRPCAHPEVFPLESQPCILKQKTRISPWILTWMVRSNVDRSWKFFVLFHRKYHTQQHSVKSFIFSSSYSLFYYGIKWMSNWNSWH